MRLVDLTGNVYGRLTVVHKGNVAIGGQIRWICQCSCGNTKAIRGALLKNGKTKSCGCLRQESNVALKTTHGLRGSDEYRIWSNILERCENPKSHAFKYYGGRGISVCDRWKTFNNFFEDMGKRPTRKHSIDRIDNNLGYEPSNCKWSTSIEQNRNRRDNIFYTCNGVTATLSELCQIYGCKYSTVYMRLSKGASIDLAMTPGRIAYGSLKKGAQHHN